MDRMMGECVAVLVDALLPLRTNVGELACDRGDPSICKGEGTRLREGDWVGDTCFVAIGTWVGVGEGVRGRVSMEGA